MHAIDIVDLKKTYRNQQEAIKGINLQVVDGDFFALLGPNGAGKSTTLSIVCSLLSKTSGTISIYGHDLDTARQEAKACIGLMPQEFNSTLLETVENILVRQAGYYGVTRRIALERSEYYLQMLGLWDKRHTESRQLSGGEKRCMMLIRALIHDPKLLVIDEPTANVDIETRRKIWGFLSQLNRDGKTILLTTHNFDEAESLCNNVAIIKSGEIILQEPIQSLLKSNETESLLLYLDKPIHATPYLKNCKCELRNQTTLEVKLNNGVNLNHIFHELSEQKLVIIGIVNKSNRLEELFLDLIMDAHE